ncbi:JAB domain-containing protein [Finegoldia magna]|uniref:Putative DNA repair protein n=1 Tax=Finegoldia magna (strain ATCC 29328 / DSM 20472 / WAL 2508) TaxID=334413 RepID=B0S468_FINM2|nr:JAB domain-containing protein [Finegoldia magna]UEA71263.1 JAB domain-containing protein [Finegoldia magna]BAG09059.1 putative DNA repair protein [Finegoldia magna ATCC 29328]
MKLKELELVVRDTVIKYDGREKVIDNFLIESTKKQHNKPEAFEKLLFNYFSLFKDEKERLISILLDTKNKIIGIDLVSIGTLNSSLVHPRELFRKAILAGANSIIIAHNHPSNSTEPSSADIAMAKRLEKCGDILGIPLLDSLIIAFDSTPEKKGRLLSMRQNQDF